MTLSAPKGEPMTPSDSKNQMAPAQLISAYISNLDDWRSALLARLRKLILEADPDLVEEWKWETPVWSRKGNVVACGVFKDHVKLNFFKGASLEDQHSLFNAGLEAKASRSIDIHEGDKIDEPALTALIRAAVAYNLSGGKSR
jgi:hypothetical protein